MNKKKKDQKQNYDIHIRINQKQLEHIKRSAEELGLSTSAYVRMKLMI